MTIVAWLLAKYRGYDRIEKFIGRSSFSPVIGFLLVIIALSGFLFGIFKIDGNNYIRGFDLVFKYHHLIPTLQFSVYILTVFVLIFGKTDKFRYATLFSVISLLLVFATGFSEMPEGHLVLPYGKHVSDLNMMFAFSGMFTSLICILIFGLRPSAETQNRVFKLLHKINAKIQADHDKMMEEKRNKNDKS